ncbi:hypothetical protein Y032_0522g2878 [Ancylostoma ceylanicum]|uniref:Uncharacterized protein n=1 Tax=Ancylostoma ceylanicum TaxID=53326 RepID=A0A016WSL7_9BILA|nr:hypothetical protein Y032_0522g2878 [Ancylostoma ceylanicum]
MKLHTILVEKIDGLRVRHGCRIAAGPTRPSHLDALSASLRSSSLATDGAYSKPSRYSSLLDCEVLTNGRKVPAMVHEVPSYGAPVGLGGPQNYT